MYLLDNYLQFLGYKVKSKTITNSVNHNAPPELYCSLVVNFPSVVPHTTRYFKSF